jgi:3-hydroxyisobutyrate dehydrogenase
MSYIGMFEVAVLGLGAMGSRMAARLLQAGHVVTVFNRSPAPAEPLLARGAHWAATPREAAQGADFVISMVRDDEASRTVWTDATHGALHGMSAAAVAIESSTLSPQWVRELAALAQQQIVTLVDAPVVGSRPQAETGQLIYLVGGEAQTVERLDLLLRAMGGAVHHTGPVGSAALIKLMVNALFGMQAAAMAELLGLAQASGLNAAKALEIMAATPVISPAAKGASAAMLAGQFAPLFPLELVDKDFGYLLHAARAVAADTPVAQRVSQVLQTALAQGLQREHITALAKLYMPSNKR